VLGGPRTLPHARVTAARLIAGIRNGPHANLQVLSEFLFRLFTSGHGTARLHFFGACREAHFGIVADVAGRSQTARHVVVVVL
jgi:hypothetical protein